MITEEGVPFKPSQEEISLVLAGDINSCLADLRNYEDFLYSFDSGFSVEDIVSMMGKDGFTDTEIAKVILVLSNQEEIEDALSVDINTHFNDLHNYVYSLIPVDDGFTYEELSRMKKASESKENSHGSQAW